MKIKDILAQERPSVSFEVFPPRKDAPFEPVKDAVFEFAGKELPVKDGAASMTFAEFIAGKHSVPIWLHRKGKKPVPGVPTFG